MTVIACSVTDTAANIAADSSVSGDDVVALSAQKIFCSGNTLVGICGGLKFNDAAYRYWDEWDVSGSANPKAALQKLAGKLRKEFPPTADEAFEYVVAYPGHIFLIDTTYAVIELVTRFHAIGSGALGALAVIQAVYTVPGVPWAPSVLLPVSIAVEAVIPFHTDVKGPVHYLEVGGSDSEETCESLPPRNKKSGRKSSKRPASKT